MTDRTIEVSVSGSTNAERATIAREIRRALEEGLPRWRVEWVDQSGKTPRLRDYLEDCLNDLDNAEAVIVIRT